MGSNLSIAETLAYLETQIAYHREQRELHAKQASFHSEQTGIHDAELAKSVHRFEALKAASDALGDLVIEARPASTPPPPPTEEVATSGWRWLSRLVTRLVESKAPDQTFSATTIAQEIGERWGPKLSQQVDPRTIAAFLSRSAARGEIHRIRAGRAYHESWYARRGQVPVTE